MLRAGPHCAGMLCADLLCVNHSVATHPNLEQPIGIV